MLRAADRYSPEHAGLELLARSLRHLLRRNYLTIALLTRSGAGALKRERLEELMRMLTQRLSLLFEFAPPDFYERSTFASYIDTLLETGLVHEDADGSLRLHEHTRTWERYVERLLPRTPCSPSGASRSTRRRCRAPRRARGTIDVVAVAG